MSSRMGLEVWAIGSYAEIEALRLQLRQIGTFAVPTTRKGKPMPTEPEPLGGADRHRYRWYVRVLLRH